MLGQHAQVVDDSAFIARQVFIEAYPFMVLQPDTRQ